MLKEIQNKVDSLNVENPEEFNEACKLLIQVRKDKKEYDNVEKMLSDMIKEKMPVDEEINGLILTKYQSDQRDNKKIDELLKVNGLYDILVKKVEFLRLSVVKNKQG